MPYTYKQKRIAKHIIDVGQRKGATRKEKLAALETALVEANLSNPRGGHADSVGWRQERGHYGSVGRRRNVRGAAGRFFDETKQNRKKYKTAGQLAQSVQRSAYPGRYDQRGKQAADLLNWLEKGQKVKGMRGSKKTKTTKTVAGYSGAEEVQAARRQYLTAKNPTSGGLLRLARVKREQAALEAANPGSVKTVTKVTKGRRGRVKKGRRTKTDIDHIMAYARKLGLRVGENPRAGGVAPVHTQGSYHYRKSKTGAGAAADISGDPRKMARLARYLSKRYGRDLEELIYRGPGSRDSHNIKHGKRVGRGFYSAHEDHVHVADVD